MVKKKIDARVRTLVENGVQLGHRTVFVLVGDRGKDQVVNLHYMLSKASVRARPSVLWCYKKELGFTTHRKKRMKELKRKMKHGLIDPDQDDPFELFLSATDIRWCYYSETHKVLGRTYGMCVLQDFEALTPNLLARTIETVEGGGIIVLLLRSVKSLKQLYTMSMDVHSRYRTEAHQDVVPRFNERFLLSLKDMKHCLFLDDTLDVLPWARQTLKIAPVPPRVDDDESNPALAELKRVKVSLADSQPIGCLVNQARTLDQARAILTFVEAISEKTLRSTVTLTAARGRGKSAALGLAMAAAIAYGYTNTFVTSPSPENLGTLFEFVFKGFDALGYKEHTDYEIVQSTNPDFNKAIVRVNVFHESHRQIIQYIHPQDASKLGQAELVVIDEAAAIPLPLVKALLGPYLVFMASTVNGYEGTGRSLSLKLIDQLRKQSSGILSGQVTETKDAAAAAEALAAGGAQVRTTAMSASGARVLREITLETPIRYNPGDPVENWLNRLLCLDASIVSRASSGCPHPDECELYAVDRDSLFSYHKVSEVFLQRLMALYVASHYKNTPDDLQLLSDAPAHRIFCLLPPLNPDASSLPEILCVIQVALEGEISKESIRAGLRRGQRSHGDLIPWTLSQQFQDDDFGSLSGARIVRIASHPDYQNMGYGSRALELLRSYYSGDMASLSEEGRLAETPQGLRKISDAEVDVLEPRKHLPPLLNKLTDVPAERLDYLGVAFGMTAPLFKFWKRAGFVPTYVRQTQNALTGEFTCIMLRPLETSQAPDGWMETYWTDFQRRFMSLLSFSFKVLPPSLALSVVERQAAPAPAADAQATMDALSPFFTNFDLKRVHSYAKNLVDHHVITDLVPNLTTLFFRGPLGTSLSTLQRAILLGMGLQHKTVEEVCADLEGLQPAQCLALFSQAMRKFSKMIATVQETEAGKRLPKHGKMKDTEMEPLVQTLADEQEAAAAETSSRLAADLSMFSQFAVDDVDFSEAQAKDVSVKRSAKKQAAAEKAAAERAGDKADGKKSKKQHKRKSSTGDSKRKKGRM